MQTPHVYLNGRILPLSEAAISPLDIGLLRGYAVFDLLRTVNGRPFLLEDHLKRLRASAAELDLTVPASDSEIAEAIDELLALNRHAEATVRLVLTGGVSPEGMKFDRSTPTFFILTHELHAPPAAVYERGTKLVTQEHQRELPSAKTTNYLTMLKHRPRADDAGGFDLLYHTGGVISEAASASFYIVKNGAIHAPRRNVLWGTIGTFVLDFAKEQHEIVYGRFTLADALAADEAFLTSTTRGVVPIVALDDAPVGDGSVGPITRELMALYDSAVFGS